MTAQRLKSAFDAQPFKPFDIRLTEGRRIRINHREFAALSPLGRTAVVYQPDDSMEIIELCDVTSLEFQ